MASIFTRIINGEIPSYKVAEDDRYYAFLDISPMTKGHTLVVPKVEVDYLFDLDPQVLADMTVFAQKVANGIKAVMPCKRVGVAVLGMEVPHAHIHLVPISKESDLDFRKEKLKLSPEEFADIAKAIAENIK
ncbi:HIT family protein [uncultured Acetobacteroides sp.]|uniref:HIT family protein n=1 Tax=uncultured Acetobacteroides sp. TaxID=1760811 RepID=UPI0029F50345|nr:HIT family protein [uncultured Acetobacteroides sp.]